MSAQIETRRRRAGAKPQQQRSERTRQRLLDAAEELLVADGVNGLSIPAIVARAGSSVGGFYARFKDKNELLRALEERFFADMGKRVAGLIDPERWEGLPTAVIVDAAIGELVSVVRTHKQLVAAFLLRALQDDELRDEGIAFRDSVSQSFRTFLATDRREDVAHPEPELALDLAVQAAFAFMEQHILLGETRSVGRVLSDEDLVRELARLVRAYVGIEEFSAPGAGQESRPRSADT